MKETEKRVKEDTNKKSTKKWMAIISILVIIVAIGTGVGLKIYNGSKYEYKIEEVKEINYVITSKNGKVGVIDKVGNVIIDPQYENIQIPNPEKPVFVCLYDYDSAAGEYNSKVLNDKHQDLFPEFERVQAITISTDISDIPYEKSILKYKENGKYGLVSLEGKKITKAIYDSIEALEYKEGTLLVKQNEKYGVINMKGIKIIDPQYDSITADGFYNAKVKFASEGFIVSKKTSEGYRYGYITSEGKEFLAVEYNEISRINEMEDKNNIYFITYKNGQAGFYKNQTAVMPNQYEEMEYDKTSKLISIQRNGKQGVANLAGEIIVPMQYDNIIFAGKYINAEEEGKVYIYDINGNPLENTDYITMIPTDNANYYVTIDSNDNYGVIDGNNHVVIQNQYSYIDYAFDGYFIVSKDGMAGVVDTKGNMIVDFKYNLIQRLKNSKVLQAITTISSSIDLLDQNIQEIASLQYGNIYVGEDYIKLYSDNVIIYFDFTGKEISNKEVYKNNKILAKEQDGKWGFVDRNDNVVVDFQYDIATDLNEFGFASVKLNGKWGVINSEGKVIKDTIYKINAIEPSFIGEYYLVNLGYGQPYYSNEVVE